MTDFVSICGLSSAGKKTLIRRVLEDRDGVRERFSLRFPIRAFGRSFEPPEDMMRCASGTALFQWQWVHDRFLEELCGLGPPHTHRVIALWRPIDEQFRDVLRVYGENWEGTRDDLAKQWNERFVPRFRDRLEQAEGVRVDVVDASVPGYPRLGSWPIA